MIIFFSSFSQKRDLKIEVGSEVDENNKKNQS